MNNWDIMMDSIFPHTTCLREATKARTLWLSGDPDKHLEQIDIVLKFL